MNGILGWIEQWYAGHCNEDWEHDFSIKIQTIDNPGWKVRIDLEDTELEDINIQYELIESSENDWYGIEIKEKRFIGVGDPFKLELLLNEFKKLAVQYSKSK